MEDKQVLFNNREIEGFVLSLFNEYNGEYSLNDILNNIEKDIKNEYSKIFKQMLQFIYIYAKILYNTKRKISRALFLFLFNFRPMSAIFERFLKIIKKAIDF